MSRRNYILCVGLTPALQRTMQFRRVRVGEVNRAASVIVSAAGKGPNVVRALRTLGANVVVTGFIGGNTGAAVVRDLERAGIRTAFVPAAHPTRVCETLIDRATGAVTELVEEAAPLSPVEWRAFFAQFAKLLAGARLVTISGTLPPHGPVGAYEKLVRMAGKHGVPVVIDSQGEPLLRAVRAGVLMAKLNEEEMAATCGLLNAGAENVVITSGAKGARLISRAGNWRFRSPRITPVNPIGSGDAMTAGIAFALARGNSVTEAVRLGVACGAANALTLTPGTIALRTVRSICLQVTVKPR